MTAVSPEREIAYSIGHSSQTAESFVGLLRRHGITTLVDVRSQPHSQYSPQFNYGELQQVLEDEGIEYLFAGDTLGGRPGQASFYDREGRVLYYKVAGESWFEDGIARLRFLLQERERVAIMCSEEDPAGCHRRLLVGRVLAEQGVLLRHIRGDGRIQEEHELSGSRKVSSVAQRGFFDGAEESSWKSLRSVLPARPRSGSSSH